MYYFWLIFRFVVSSNVSRLTSSEYLSSQAGQFSGTGSWTKLASGRSLDIDVPKITGGNGSQKVSRRLLKLVVDVYCDSEGLVEVNRMTNLLNPLADEVDETLFSLDCVPSTHFTFTISLLLPTSLDNSLTIDNHSKSWIKLLYSIGAQDDYDNSYDNTVKEYSLEKFLKDTNEVSKGSFQFQSPLQVGYAAAAEYSLGIFQIVIMTMILCLVFGMLVFIFLKQKRDMKWVLCREKLDEHAKATPYHHDVKKFEDST